MPIVKLKVQNNTGLILQLVQSSQNWPIRVPADIDDGDTISFEASFDEGPVYELAYRPVRGTEIFVFSFELRNRDIRSTTRVPPRHNVDVNTRGTWPELEVAILWQ